MTPNITTKDANKTIRYCAFSFEEQAVFVENLATILKPSEIATKILCAEHNSCCCKPNKVLKTNEDDPKIIENMKLRMKADLVKMSETEEIALAECVLRPYTKDFTFMPELKLEAHELLGKLA